MREDQFLRQRLQKEIPIEISPVLRCLITTPGSECALTSLAIDEPLEYVRLYLDGNLQMWINAEDSLEI